MADEKTKWHKPATIHDRSKNISGDQGHFPTTFFLKYLTGCACHCCIVGANHGIYVRVISPQTDEWCDFFHLLLLEKCIEKGEERPRGVKSQLTVWSA